MTAGSPDLTVVVPTYNERDRLAELVTAAFAACADAGIDFEVVVVDDNSPDGTGAVADDLATRHRMKVVHRTGKLGLGTAVVAGVAVATSEVVGVMDADFSHPPSLLPAMHAVFAATGADVVVASRYVPGGGTSNWPMGRRLLSRFGCLLARPLSPVRDAASGFFLIRRDVARAVRVKAGGFKIGLELIVRGRPQVLVEMPYTFDDRQRGESKMSAKEAAGYLVQLKDLYGVAWTGPRRTWRYRQVTAQEADELTRTARATRLVRQ